MTRGAGSYNRDPSLDGGQAIGPILAGLAHQKLPPPPPKLSALDQHHLTLRAELQRTCQTIGLAA